MAIEDQPFMGITEIAAYFGVSKNVVVNWVRRQTNIPQPFLRLAMGPMWRTEDIVKAKQERDERKRSRGNS